MDDHNRFEAIQLNDADFITKGSHNLVYRHPHDPECLIKVLGIVKVLGLIQGPHRISGLDQRFLNSKWIGGTKLMRLINRFRLQKAHVREFMEIVRLRFYDEFLVQPPLFMQKVLGFVDTNLGFAMVVKAERDKEGNFAPTLSSLIKKNKIDNQVKEQLEILYKQILAYDLIVSDLHPENIVYSYSPTQGHHFVLIDGIGDKNIVPVLRLSHYLRKRAKVRIIEKLRKRVSRGSS